MKAVFKDTTDAPSDETIKIFREKKVSWINTDVPRVSLPQAPLGHLQGPPGGLVSPNLSGVIALWRIQQHHIPAHRLDLLRQLEVVLGVGDELIGVRHPGPEVLRANVVHLQVGRTVRHGVDPPGVLLNKGDASLPGKHRVTVGRVPQLRIHPQAPHQDVDRGRG